VTGDSGFEVEEAFPYNLFYREGGRVVRFSAEMTGADSAASIILFDDDGARRWEPPHEKDALGAAAARDILVRVNAALLVLEIKAVWQAIPPEAERSDWEEIRAEARNMARSASARSLQKPATE
jgi:hypothetical protein